MAFKIPRLPINWKTQPELFERYWSQAMDAIERSINGIRDLLIQVGIAQATADGGLELAQAAINPDGTIKNSKVLTTSIGANSVNKPYFVQTTSPIVMPDGVNTTVCALTMTKDITDSDVEISALVRLNSSDDLRGTFTIIRDFDVIDTLEIFINGSGGTIKLPFPILFRDFTASAGSHNYSVRFQRNGGASAVSAVAGTNLSAIEVKR